MRGRTETPRNARLPSSPSPLPHGRSSPGDLPATTPLRPAASDVRLRALPARAHEPLHAVRRLAALAREAAQLRGMIHHGEELIRERTQRKNKLTAICDEVFPEFVRICTDPNSPSALALRKAFPTPAALATTSMSALKAAR